MTTMDKDFNPMISIIIPVFNGANFLAQAIDSALGQTYRNIEILVINDGSDDAGETDRIALSYGNRIHYYQKSNGGVASALNMAIEMMSGEYFSWLSHDDLYDKEKIKRQIEVLSSMSFKDRERAIVYSDYCVFTTNPENTIPMRLRGVEPEDFRYWLTIENSLHGCTLLIPKTAFTIAGIFNEQLQTTQDYDLWFRMAKNYKFFHLPELLVKSRSHPEQGSIKMAGFALKECNSLMSGFVANLTHDEILRASPQAPALGYARIAESMWYRGFKKAGWMAMLFSFKNFLPTSLRANFLSIIVMARGIIKHCLFKPAKRLIPPNIRWAIQSWLAPKTIDEVVGLKKQLKLRDSDSVRNLGLKEKFSEVYERNIFGGSVSRSGEGSDLSQTAIIRDELPKLLKELDIQTFLDAPCGDWYWMREVDLPVERYIGLDIVDALVTKNQVAFGNSKVSFQCMNLAEGGLPKADLIFSRDCLVHLSFTDALKIIANFKRSGAKYLLTTTFTDRKKNEDLGDGFWRPLNKQLAPFFFPKPIRLINEGCTEGNNLFTDKCLGLWLLQDINLLESA